MQVLRRAMETNRLILCVDAPPAAGSWAVLVRFAAAAAAAAATTAASTAARIHTLLTGQIPRPLPGI